MARLAICLENAQMPVVVRGPATTVTRLVIFLATVLVNVVVVEDAHATTVVGLVIYHENVRTAIVEVSEGVVVVVGHATSNVFIPYAALSMCEKCSCFHAIFFVAVARQVT